MVFLNTLFRCHLSWIKDPLSKWNQPCLLFAGIPDFLFLSNPEFLLPDQLSCWSVCNHPSAWNVAKVWGSFSSLKVGLAILYYILDLWGSKVPWEPPGARSLNSYLLPQKPEDQIASDPRSRQDLPRMLMPQPHLDKLPWNLSLDHPHLTLPRGSQACLLIPLDRGKKAQIQQLTCTQLSVPSLMKGLIPELTSQCGWGS